MINYADAMDEIRATFRDKWDADSALIVGYVPEIRYMNVELPTLPNGSKFWARFQAQTLEDEQATLSTCEGAPGQKKYTNSGFLIIELYCPKSEVRANEFGERLAMIARDAYRGKATKGRVWFRNARIQEQPQENLYYRFNVVCDFEYDEIA